MPYRSTVIFGGVGINPQMAKLIKGIDIVIATPGSLLDIAGQDGIDFSKLECLVLDEADRMLDMGFIMILKNSWHLCLKKSKPYFFLQHFLKRSKHLLQDCLNNPVLVEVARENTTAEQISQVVHHVDKSRKRELLAQLIKAKDGHRYLSLHVLNMVQTDCINS